MMTMQNTRLLESIGVKPLAKQYTLENLFTLNVSVEGDTPETSKMKMMVENYKKGDRSVNLNTLCGILEAHLHPELVTPPVEDTPAVTPPPVAPAARVDESGRPKLNPLTTPIPAPQLPASLNESCFRTLRESCGSKQFYKRLAEFKDSTLIPESDRNKFAKAITSAFTHMIIESEVNPTFKNTLDTITPVFERYMFTAIRTGRVEPTLRKVIQLVIKEA